MSNEAVIGVVVTLLVGIPAYFVVSKRKSIRQSQKVGKEGTGYQAGGNINISDDGRSK